MAENMQNISYRVLNKHDLPLIIDLMTQIKPPIAGMRSKSIYTALCRDALKDHRLLILVAQKDSELIGFTIAIIDRATFWRDFSFRHPHIAGKIFLIKLKARLSRTLKHVTAGLNQPDQQHTDIIKKWIEQSLSIPVGNYFPDQIAHTQFTAVAKGHRGERVGVNLQNHRDRILKELGIKQLRSNVKIDNVSGIMMNYRRGGWKAERNGQWISMARDI